METDKTVPKGKISGIKSLTTFGYCSLKLSRILTSSCLPKSSCRFVLRTSVKWVAITESNLLPEKRL